MPDLTATNTTPTDVTVTTVASAIVAPGVLTTWTRTTSKKGLPLAQPITVGYVPSADPSVRARQEIDLARHLDERTPDV